MQPSLASNQGYGRSLGFGQNPALFISDMQNAYVDPSYVRGMDMTKEIKIINELIRLSKMNNVPIFFSVIAFDEDNIKHPNLWMQKIAGLSDLKLGTETVALTKKISFDHAKDKLIIKQFPSAFFSTTFAAELINRKIDTLIISGCTTSGCVRATAIDSLQMGFRPMIVADAVADRWPNSHQQALFELNAKYADVLTSQIVFDYFKQLKKKHD